MCVWHVAEDKVSLLRGLLTSCAVLKKSVAMIVDVREQAFARFNKKQGTRVGVEWMGWL